MIRDHAADLVALFLEPVGQAGELSKLLIVLFKLVLNLLQTIQNLFKCVCSRICAQTTALSHFRKRR